MSGPMRASGVESCADLPAVERLSRVARAIFDGHPECSGVDLNADGRVSAADMTTAVGIPAVGEPSVTPTAEMEESATATETATASVTPSSSATGAPVPSASPSATFSANGTPTASVSVSATPSASVTGSPPRTSTRTLAPSFTPTFTPTRTLAPTRVPSFTGTVTPTGTNTRRPTLTASPTRTTSDTPTATATKTRTATRSLTASPSASKTRTESPTVTLTPTRTDTPTGTLTKTPSASRTPSFTRTAIPTVTASRTRTETPTATETATRTFSRTPSFTRTASPTVTATKTRTVTPTATAAWTRTVTRTATVSPTVTLTRIPSATPSITPTQAPSGPWITFFGLASADGIASAPDGVDPQDGTPIYEQFPPQGFLIIVEAKRGTSGRLPGTSTFNWAASDPTLLPDFQLIASRDLGNGSVKVCDNTPGNLGGVPAVNPPSFGGSQSVANSINDMGCRFDARTTSGDACTVNAATRDPGFVVKSESTTQFCSSPGVGSEIGFPVGDTRLSVRILDDLGNPGPPATIIVRVP